MNIPLNKMKKKNAINLLNLMGWSNGPTGGRVWTKGDNEIAIDSTKQLKTFALLKGIGMKPRFIKKELLKMKLP